MTFDRQLVRLMGAMIAMIVVYLAPSVVQAHDGHAHHDHRQRAAATVEAAPAVAPTPSSRLGSLAIPLRATIVLTARPMAAPAAVGSLQSDARGGGCCPGPCAGTCCGAMSCCMPGILTGAASLPTRALGHAVLLSCDVSGLPGVGPEALPRPPRTPA